jgi:hypothetical protein
MPEEVVTLEVTVIRYDWGAEARCQCGWQASAPDPSPAGDCLLMALVDSHLEAHRREGGR